MTDNGTLVVQIPLSQGKAARLDSADFERVGQFKWTYTRDRSGKEYAVRFITTENGKRTSQRLHRFLLNAPDGLQVDHVNGDGLDCRRENLRLATHTQNQGNKKLQSNNSTGFRGVSFDKQTRKFMASISINGKSKTLGRFVSAEDAARAYDKAAKEHFGHFAKLNFSEGEQP